MSEGISAEMPEEKKSSKLGCIALAVAAVGLVVLVSVVLLFWLAVRSLGGSAADVARGTVLEVELAGSFSEGPVELDLGPFFGSSTSSLWEIRRGLRAAADDPDIVGIRLRLGSTFLGWPAADEILASLDRFRAAGKPVYALMGGDMVGDLEYFLATGADRIWLTPEAAAVINGVVAEAQFFRGTLEKLHVEPEVIMYKEYKSAGEPFANYEMSEYMRESLSAVLDSIHARFLERVVERRGVDRSSLVEFLGRGMAPASALLDLGLVDELGYADQVEAAFVDRLEVEEYRRISLSKYLASLGRSRTPRGTKIAVVFGEGAVVTDAPESLFPLVTGAVLAGSRVAANLRQAAADPKVVAIVFRVNSPGGSAVGSDLVRRAIERARAEGTPVVASLSDLAGSGGYWVAMAADSIVAHSTTMTGSIGVVFTKFALDGFFEWIGTHVDRVTTSPAAGIFGTGSLAEAELEGIHAWMDTVYGSFTEKVAASRGLDLEHVLEVAKGRVWSGRDALDLGLIDHLGGMDEAVDLAKELAGLEADDPVALVVVPRPRSLFERLLGENRVAIRSRGGLLGDTSLFGDIGTPLVSVGQLERWLRQVSDPQVQVRMPDVTLR